MALGLGACGSSGDPSAVVARVGDRAITKASVDDWTDIVRRGGAFTDGRGSPARGTARQRALALLISSYWLIGEAERRGRSVSAQAVDRALEERAEGKGAVALGRRLARKGQTIAGLELELEAELARDAILQQFAERIERITPSEVAAYYRAHLRLFSTPEVRVLDIVEHLPSPAAATALVKRVGTGRRFNELAYHKRTAYTTGLLAGEKNKKEVDYAIFTAPQGVVSRPMRLEGAWAVFIVRKVLPPKPKALAAVRGDALKYLREIRPRQMKAQLSREFTTRWRAETSCDRAYVAPGCPQYQAPLGEYEDPFASR